MNLPGQMELDLAISARTSMVLDVQSLLTLPPPETANNLCENEHSSRLQAGHSQGDLANNLCEGEYDSQQSRSADEGKRRKKAGMRRAMDNQDQWANAFLDFLAMYASKHDAFLMQDVRVEWEGCGGESPRHLNSWGAVTSIAARRGLIRKTGNYRKARLAESHAHVYAEWTKGDK